jgi:hypothetical protein
LRAITLATPAVVKIFINPSSQLNVKTIIPAENESAILKITSICPQIHCTLLQTIKRKPENSSAPLYAIVHGIDHAVE